MPIFILIIISTWLLACNKPNPTPELVDPIYIDLQQQAQSAKKELESEIKKNEGYKKEVESAVPQTGAIKYAQKRFFESEARVDKLKQEVKFYELKVDSRKQFARKMYAKAYKNGEIWPNEEEFVAYKTQKALSNIETSWKTKKRVESYENSQKLSGSRQKTEESNKE